MVSKGVIVGNVVFNTSDVMTMIEREAHYLERIHDLEEEMKDLKGCKCDDGYVGMIDEHCRSGS